ncbi:MAG: hypothetical protein ACREQV_05465, partial [Candidatus Binatia bacterium]
MRELAHRGSLTVDLHVPGFVRDVGIQYPEGRFLELIKAGNGKEEAKGSVRIAGIRPVFPSYGAPEHQAQLATATAKSLFFGFPHLRRVADHSSCRQRVGAH